MTPDFKAYDTSEWVDFLSIMLILTLALNMIAVILGFFDQGRVRSDCGPPYSRMINYVTPGFKLGCWLGEKPND
jgi:hypothetical protein